MQKQRLKIWVPPAQCGKKSFGTVWDNTVSILRQGLLLHCSARRTEALLALPNDNESWTEMFSRTRYRARHLLRPEGQTKPLAICYNCIRWDSNPRISSLTGSRSKCSSGIHFGTSSCTAVKDWLKHRLEVTLQAYFTILLTVFHGKKAAKITKKPSNESFFAILIHSLTVFSVFRWLISGRIQTPRPQS